MKGMLSQLEALNAKITSPEPQTLVMNHTDSRIEPDQTRQIDFAGDSVRDTQRSEQKNDIFPEWARQVPAPQFVPAPEPQVVFIEPERPAPKLIFD